jgi:hypothetical protein
MHNPVLPPRESEGGPVELAVAHDGVKWAVEVRDVDALQVVDKRLAGDPVSE